MYLQYRTRHHLGAPAFNPAFQVWLEQGIALLVGFLNLPWDGTSIHQTYARNLAETGQLAYLPGQPCSGHTSRSIAALLGFPPV
jgi:hypothetical protein